MRQPVVSCPSRPGTITDVRVSSALYFIEQNLHDPTLTVERIARHVGLSSSGLRQLIHRYKQISPKQYLLERRLGLAHEHLHSTLMTVKEVMASVGISDPSRFSKQYKRRFQVAPSRDRGDGLRKGDGGPYSQNEPYHSQSSYALVMSLRKDEKLKTPTN